MSSSNANPVLVSLIINQGAGFAQEHKLDAGTSIADFFRRVCPDKDPSSYTIRVNRRGVGAGYVLQNGDTVSVSPTKVAGAIG